MSPTRWTTRVVAPALALACLLAGCSGGSRPSSSGPARQPGAPSSNAPAGAGASGQNGAAPPAGATGTPAAAVREPGFGVTPISLPSPARRGQMVTAAFQARPGTTCQLTVDEQSGGGGQAPLPPAVADASGRVTWTWRLSAKTEPGSVTAWVACSGGGIAQAQLTVV